MPIFQQLLKALKASTINVSWSFLFMLAIAHMTTSWALMALSGEVMAESFTLWVYYYIVSASTVGYGDMSPVSAAGQWGVALYVIPGGISLFAALIGKATVSVSTFWRNQMQGKGNYTALRGHTVVIGWHGEATEKIIDILKADSQLPDEIVLCVVKDINNPRPADVKFVKGASFSDADFLKRAGIEGASRVIIYDQCDERVATVALSAYHLKGAGCHLVAHCDNPATATMLRRTLPGIECTEALALEMLVRSATDAGISRVVNELLAVDHGATQFQTRLEQVPEGAVFGTLFSNAKAQHNVTVLGVSSCSHDSDMLNPPADRPIQSGDLVYYMASQRLTPEQFGSLLVAHTESPAAVSA
ncbi:potassium channel family protein [Vreelandella rituensis]|uniref:Calcium-gated potassium channel protein n=1 Tax=Vreelandella rituensis TaxID=2282306 RepID=A0A368U913_9GAMM|nr:potassium channel family protein [Halomonas rituensis]RCV93580.1 calcium-gated potassium channel protein [Halomonas rituensis]